MENRIINLDGKSKFNIMVDQDMSLTLVGITTNFKGTFFVNENAILNLSILSTAKDIDIKIDGKVAKNSSLKVYYADFSSGKSSLVSKFDLVDENANYNWQLASLSKNNDKKVVDVTVNHMHSHTFSKINNYGVSRGLSELLFSGVCKIENGSIMSKANQNAKIMVFDLESKGIAKPILKIDENDVEASHAAVVGKISDDQLFYLTSRGINIDKAKELVTFGYLKPILLGFNDEYKKKITEIIEGSF